MLLKQLRFFHVALRTLIPPEKILRLNSEYDKFTLDETQEEASPQKVEQQSLEQIIVRDIQRVGSKLSTNRKEARSEASSIFTEQEEEEEEEEEMKVEEIEDEQQSST